jgi:hypothetical protein
MESTYQTFYDFTQGIINAGMVIVDRFWPLVLLAIIVAVFALVRDWTLGSGASGANGASGDEF